ncbi:hypothetical protein EG329_008579 [Mollisiaceae sp. DMI_Dod_QoI]|nr:hypothetical protein EG329_008579 [Helotiales sp. DMI_Dod_QoI]
MASSGILYDPFGNPLPGNNTVQDQNPQDHNPTGQQGQSSPPDPTVFVPPVFSQNPYHFRSPQPQQGQAPPPSFGWLPPSPRPVNAQGLPLYFNIAPLRHPHLDAAHRARELFYYINDGPRLPGESDRDYKTRITRAKERMGIEVRMAPPAPSTKDYPKGYLSEDWKAAESYYLRHWGQQQTFHINKLNPLSSAYDENYEANWVAEKQSRQARNAARRQQAVEEVRGHFQEVGYDRLPTPDPAEDSGDDLHDWGAKGPRMIKYRRAERQEPYGYVAQPVGSQTSQPAIQTSGGASSSAQPTAQQTATKSTRKHRAVLREGKERALWPSLFKCQRCRAKVFGHKCDMVQIGRPCTNCQEAQAICIPDPLRNKPPGYKAAYPQGHTGMFNWSDDRRSRSPTASRQYCTEVATGQPYSVGSFTQGSPALSSGYNSGGVLPRNATDSLNGLIDPSLANSQNHVNQPAAFNNYYNTFNNSFASGPSGFGGFSGPSNTPPTSAYQIVPDMQYGNPSDYTQNLRPFSDARNAEQDQNLQNPVSGDEELQNANYDWATREPEAPADPFAPQQNAFAGFDAAPEDFDVEAFIANMEAFEQDTEMGGVDEYPAIPGFGTGLDPHLPMPTDHATMQYNVQPPQQQEQQQQETPAYNPFPLNDAPPPGPVLPEIPFFGTNDMLGFGTGCMEIPNAFSYFPGLEEEFANAPTCKKEPTRPCEYFEHSHHSTCQDCHNECYDETAVGESRAIATTKWFFCQPCAAELKDILKTGGPGSDLLGTIGKSMSRPVVLSVNGRPGSDITDERQVEQNRELIVSIVDRRAATSINGAHGADATPAHRGEPAGTLYVELTESPTRQEGFLVRTRMQVPENRNPKITEILPHKNVVFEAAGGDGEAGRRGYDGQSGMDGTPGEDATKVQDATDGTPGGNGGNAGAGTNGGDGGNGGQVRLYVDEDETHLLLATSWEVRGGKGGVAGEHGAPGPGGKGGKGGQDISWREQNGYQYKCTPNCAGRTTAPSSNVKSLSKRDPRMLMLQGIGQQVSAGSNIQTAVARLAQYRPNTLRDTSGLCLCSGGNGHCTGCDALPVFQEKHRLKGGDGMDGQKGEKPTDPLFCGRDGRPGEGLIIVKPKTAAGIEKQYRSIYQLELVDFDLEDENEDGIFEPGEHLFIRRIRVKNSGGMPSPTRQTRIEVDASGSLQPLPGNDSVAHVPSIPAGQTVTLTGSIKVLIREPDIFLHGGQPYKMTTTIALKATMPGLNRRLDNFDFQKSFEIQYPLELQDIDYLQSIAQGSENKISMQVHNQSNRIFGGGRVSPRRAEVKISIAPEAGSLRSASGIWSPEVFQTAEEVPAGSTIDMSQVFKISHRAKDHDYTTVHVQFSISSPGPAPASGRSLGDLGIPMRLTQSFNLKIQISAAHIYDEEAGILVVTNVKTPPERFEAIGDFIRKGLRLKMDVWNVIRAFGLEEQTMINLCESDIVGNECFAGSSCLLLGSAAEKSKKDAWLKHSVFPVSHKISAISTQVTETATFETKAALLRSISEQRISSMPTSQAYKIKSQQRWYYGGAKRNVKRQAKQAQSYLRSNLPQERFWVCPVYPKIDGGKIQPGYVAVWHGLPSNRNIFATESKKLLEERGKPKKLHPFDSFNIICSLSYSLRIGLLGSFDRASATIVEEREDEYVSDEEREDEYAPDEEREDEYVSVSSPGSANHSDEILNAVQFSLEEDVSREMQNYLGPSPIFNNISLGESHNPGNQFDIHFPCLGTILQRIEASDKIPPRVLEIIQIAIAATNPQTIGQIARSIALPIGQRRAQLKSYLTQRIEAILTQKGYTPVSLKEFRITTQAKHSRFSSNKRDTGKVIEERNRRFVKVPMNEYRKGRLTTEDLVEGTELCTELEWDARCQELEKTKTALKSSITRAMTKRGKMSTLKLKTVDGGVRIQEEANWD